MTDKRQFADIALEAFRFIEREKTVLDVDLMIRLRFTPPTWKVWKPKIIQKLMNFTLSKTEAEKGDHTRVRINYSKKEDTWKSEEFLE